jgi:hypothetical protein
VLRDLAAGRIPLGFGTNRGYGAITVECIELDGLDVLGLAPAQLNLNVSNQRIEEHAASGLIDILRRAWSAWLAEGTEAA